MEETRATPRRWTLLLAAAAVILILAPAAAAHAVLVSTSPAAGTVLPSAPTRLDLRFNERIDPQLSAVVLVHENQRTLLALLAADGSRLSYTLSPLEPGLYVVDWRVISAADGHLTRGAFRFGVGEVTVPAGTTGVAGPTWFEVLVRWAGLIGIFVLVGGAVAFLALPAPEVVIPMLRASLYHLAFAATIAVILAALVQVFLDAAAITVEAPLIGVSGSSLVRVVTASHTGHDLIFRVTGAVFLLLLLRPALPLEREGVGTVASVLFIGPTLTSHGLSVGLAGAAVGLIHLTAASIWIGGLAFFGAVYLPAVRSVAPDAVRPAAVRFSRIALIAVGALVLTGLIQGWLYVGAPSALASSSYGRTLLVKLIVVATLLAIAAINRWGIVPRLAAAGSSSRLLLTLVRFETMLGFAVALLAATVAISQPPKIAAQATGSTPEQAPQTLVLGGTVDDVTIRLSIRPP